MLSKILGLLVLAAGIGALIYFNPQLTQFQSSQKYLDEANSAMLASQWTHALTTLENGLREDPDNIDLSLNIARVYFQLDKPEKAEDVYRKLLIKHPENLQIRLDYGKYLSNTYSRLNEAVDQFRAAYQRHPNNPKLLAALGDFYKQAAQNPFDKGIKTHDCLYDWSIYYYRHALQSDPGNFASRFNLGVVYQQIDDKDRAAHQYCQAIQLSPTSYEPHYNLGLLLIELGAYDEAQKRFSTAINQLAGQNHMVAAQKLAEKIQIIKNSAMRDDMASDLQRNELPEWLTSCLQKV